MNNRENRIRVGDRVTIYPRGKKKTWCADFWRDGVHCRQSLKTPNKKIALQRALRLESQLASGTFQKPPPPITVRQTVDDYIKFLETENRSHKTLVKYQGILNVLAAFLEEQRIIRLSQFTTLLFDKFRAFRKQDHHRKTMYTEGVIVKQLFKWAHSRKLIVVNPVVDFKLHKPPLEPKEGPNLAQIDRILAASQSVFMIMLAVLAFTGMRSGELQRLRREDLDLTGNWLHVVSRPDAETKTKTSRKIPLHPRLRVLLEKLPKGQGPWLFTAKPSGKYPCGGHWISTKKLNDRFEQLLKRLCLPIGRHSGFTIHSLRHSFETITVNAGIPQRVIDTWLGHHSDKSMASVYYKLSDQDSQSFMTKVPFGTGIPAADAGNTEVEE